MPCLPCTRTRNGVRKVISALSALAVLLVIGFAQAALAQNDPLNFENNFFVTGDYVVAGAYGMNGTVVNGMTTGTISVPDQNPSTLKANPGITGATSVPVGAQIVGAFLYWETVESVNHTGTGAIGSFGLKNGPSYAISGLPLPAQSSVAWSSGGCPSTSTGRVVTAYRADVRSLLPLDANGNATPNQTYQITLPSSGSGAPPITLGATLVIIYRVLSKDVPLNSIVIYDGAYGQSTVNVPSSLNMLQTLQGFYDAAASPVNRLTHIVGSGQNNKFQTVYFSSDPNNLIALPSLYGSGQPAFPGWYGNWDNPTYTFGDTNYPYPPNLPSYPGNPVGPNTSGPPYPTPSLAANPIQEDAASATTQVVPSASQQGCVDWGAVIVETRVKNDDGDGLLNVWKTNQGYCDVKVNPGTCPGSTDPSWVPLPGAKVGEQDIFVQLDYMCQTKQSGTNACASGYSFNPYLTTAPDGDNVIQEVTEAFADQYADGKLRHQPLNLHVVPGWAIQEQTFGSGPTDCTDSSGNPVLCAFPNQPGVVAWKAGLSSLKNQLLKNDGSGDLCTDPTFLTCVPRFQHGRKDSWHYVVFGHALGAAKWFLINGLTDNAGALPAKVYQTGTTVTFYTSTAHGLIVSSTAGNGRVSISDAITNPNLNGIWLVTNTSCPTNPKTGTPNDCSITNTAPGPYKFQITIGTSVGAQPTYTLQTDPNLSVAPGKAGTGSGFSDLGGADSLITLGNWPLTDQTWNAKAGILMHELGHGLGLTHGGLYYDNLSSPPSANPSLNDYTPTFEANCKPNFLSVLNYSLAVDLLDNQYLDYAEESLQSLSEPNPSTATGLASAYYSDTAWYAPTDAAHAAARHCDGTPILDGSQMIRTFGPTSTLTWTTNPAQTPPTPQDINFDGNSSETFRGHSDWTPTAASPGIDLRQIGATGSLSVFSGPLNGGGGPLNGGGGPLNGGGGPLNGGGGPLNGGGGPLNGGGGPLNGGGGPGEFTHETANSYARPPLNVKASEAASPRQITITWSTPIFGTPINFNVYRSSDGGVTFNKIAPVSGTTFQYTDNPVCNPLGYKYYVTSIIQDDINPSTHIESQPSATVPSGLPLLTGCYTNSPPTVSLTSLAFSPSSVTKTDVATITWSLQDDDTGTFVSRPAAAKALSAIGPVAFDGMCPSTPPANATVTQVSTSGNGIQFGVTGANQFSYPWNTTNFNAGCYWFKLNLDSGQSEVTTSALSLLIWASDSVFPTLTTTLTPNAVFKKSYLNNLVQAGGVSPSWVVVSGALPPGLLLSSSGKVSGTPTATGTYTFGVKVTDINGNYGTQTFKLNVCKPSGC